MKNTKSKLTMKFIIGFAILGISIIAVACLTGYAEFRDDIKKHYNDEAYSVAYAAAGFLDDGTLKEYGEIARDYSNGNINQEKIDEIINSDKYKSLYNQFANLRESMGANDIYLVYCNLDILNNYNGTKEGWYPFTYVLDCYSQPELSYVLGNQGPINPDFIAPTTEIVKTGNRVDNYFESKSDYGYNTTALISLPMGDGDSLALGVEIPMLTINANIESYIKKTLLSTFGVVAIGIILFVVYLLKKVINPINTISSATSSFIENNNQISKELENIDTNDEIENLSKSVLKMEMDLNEYIDNLTKVTAEKERIGAELDVARDIQSSMLPCIFPAFPDKSEFDIFASMLAAKEVGGDFYDFFMVDDTHIAIVMADVSGKGVPAALFMVIGKTLIKDHTIQGKDLGEVFTTVNNLLCEANAEGLFITAFEAVIDLVTGDVRYVNAGHEMPIIARKDQPYEAIKIKRGFVLAGMEDFQYQEQTEKLYPGDRIFLYTDGVPEATNINNELFNMDRTLETLNKYRDLKPDELLPKVKEDIDAFVGEAPQFDDLTMLCFDYKKQMEK